MKRSSAVIFGLASLVCSLVFHASLVGGAAYFGWFTPEPTTLPELDLTTIDLSFSEAPDETAIPASPPPQPAVEPPSLPEPPPSPVVESSPTPEPPPSPVVESPPTPEPPPSPVVESSPTPEPQPVVESPPELPPPVVEPTPAPKPPPPPPVIKPPKPPTPPTPKTVVPPPPATPRPTETRHEPQKPNVTSKPQEPPIPEPQPPTRAIPPAPAPSQARVKVDKPPSPRRRIKPEYPKGARERGEEGDVTLEFEVSAKGTVGNVQIVKSCGFPELEQAAIRAVTQARFEPARRGSSKVPAPARLTLTFRLKN